MSDAKLTRIALPAVEIRPGERARIEHTFEQAVEVCFVDLTPPSEGLIIDACSIHFPYVLHLIESGKRITPRESFRTVYSPGLGTTVVVANVGQRAQVARVVISVNVLTRHL